MAVTTPTLWGGGGSGEEGEKKELWNTVELSVRKSELKTNETYKKELKHMCKQEMKGRMGVGVGCPVRPSVHPSFRPAVCCLKSSGL
jgi:hypothetical protein